MIDSAKLVESFSNLSAKLIENIVKKGPFKYYLSKIVKIQQPKKPETRTKVDFLSEQANILSKKSAHEIGSKIKKKPTF